MFLTWISAIIFTPFVTSKIPTIAGSINSQLIPKSENKGIKTIIGYYILVVIQLIVSATLVSIIKKYIKVFTTIIKFFVDIVIFIVNYFIQKEIVFK